MVGYAEPQPIFAASRQSSERREQRQTENKVLWLAMPSRILSYPKIVKGESNTKRSVLIFIAEPQPVFYVCQHSERYGQKQVKKIF